MTFQPLTVADELTLFVSPRVTVNAVLPCFLPNMFCYFVANGQYLNK